MRHVYIMDPQLTGIGGHYLAHDSQLINELQRRGIGTTLYARKTREIDVCGNSAIISTFSNEIFHEACTDALVWPMENFHACNQAFLADLNTVDTSNFSRDDLIYFPNILQNQVHAVALWIAKLPTERRPSIALMFRYLNHAMDYIQARQNKEMIALYYRYAVRQLLAVHPRTVVCADTTELTNAYRQITGAPVLELPNPMDVSELLANATERAAKDRPVVVYQGHTSPLRGFHFLPEIVERCANLRPRPKFVIQIQNRDSALAMKMGPHLERLERQQGENLRLINGPLEQKDYLNLLNEADVILLPYSPTFYGHGSSGVFTEAASIGKVVVATLGTVPVRQGKEYQLGVIPASHWTAPAMAEAVALALQRLSALSQQAKTAAVRFRHDNCARALWDKLLGALSALPPAAST